MLTTRKLLSAVRKELKKDGGPDTIYRVAKVLQIARPTVDNWDAGKTVMDDNNTLKIAVFLNIDPEYTLACIHAERAKNTDAYPFLQRLAARAKPEIAA